MYQLTTNMTRFASRALRMGRRQFMQHRSGAAALFSSSSSKTGGEWRQRQLQTLEQKFNPPSEVVESDGDLQSMWREMEGRVTRRRPRTAEELGGKTGRANIKRTDEECWLRAGLYDDDDDDDDEEKPSDKQ